MKILLLPLFALLLSLMACDAARNNNGTTTADTQPAAAVASNPELAGGISIDELDARYEGYDKAYFAGGCFWCTEASFDRIEGVADVYSGYAGGTSDNPTYKEVSYGKTDHAEAIVVYYDPEVITYDKLLDVFFVAHDPTQVNGQGPDIGAHYRSAIFPLTDEQRQQAVAKISALDESGKFSKPIATRIEDNNMFWVAEDYHQDYYENPNNPNQSYVRNVSRPKVEKVMKEFRDILKPEFK